MQHYSRIGWIFLFLCLEVSAQYEFQGGFKAQGFLNNGQNPFWAYSNQLGMISEETEALGVLDGYYRRYLGEEGQFEVGGSLFMDYSGEGDNEIKGQEYYGSVGWKNFRLDLGARARPERMLGLSSVNGDILWSNNARPMPGVVIQTTEPLRLFPWVGVEGALAHYWQNDDRFVEDSYLHFKYLSLNFRLSDRSQLDFGLHHYAQWGGVSPVFGPQPSSFKDFIRIFFGKEGGSDSFEGDQSNVLGNQLGSWQIKFRYALEEGEISLYFQNLFENTPGLQLNNFPDGIWGAFWRLPEYGIFKGLLYEYTQTTWVNATGGNYFRNFVYRSGWTYFGRVIGTPFILPLKDEPGILNNRVVAHHFGVNTGFNKLEMKFLGSFVTNKGLPEAPFNPEENVFYTQLSLQYPLGDHFQFGMNVGGDFSDVNGENLGASLSVRYYILNSYRM